MRAGLVALTILAAGCSKPVELSPLPDVKTGSFLPAVARRVEEALAQARLHPRDPESNGRLGMVLHAHAHQLDLAASIAYKRAAILDPSSFRWAYLYGLTETGAAAAASLRRATELRPDYLPAQLALGERALQIGDFTLAESAYRQAIRLDVRQARGHEGLARALAAQGKAPSRATKEGSSPVPDPVLAEVESLHAGAYFHVANGVRLFEAHKLEEAAAEFEQAVRVDPRETAARYNLIRIYGELNQPDHAQAHYDAAVSSGATSAETFLNYGAVVARKGDSSAAAELFNKALSLNPKLADANHNLGQLADARGDSGMAAVHYRKALESEPDHSGANFRLGRMLLASGKIDEAIGHFERAVQSHDEIYAAALYGLATAQRMARKPDLAQLSFESALEAAQAAGQQSLAEAIEKDLRSLRRALR